MSNPVSDFPERKTEKADFEAEDAQYRYGWGKFTPSGLQWCHRAACMLFWMSVMSTVQGMVINGFVGTSLSVLELRFGLSSTQSGLIATTYDITYLIACIPVSYYGGRAHKARLLGIGCIFMGLGSVLFFLPHFVSGIYQYSDNTLSSTTCETGVNSTRSPLDCSAGDPRSSAPSLMWLFIIAQIFHGLGCTPMYTLAFVYLDENVSRRFSSLFVAVYSMFSAVGPALGYIINGIFLSIYGDVGRVDTSSLNLKPGDPRWYGAWWIGFVMAAILALLMSFPILGYARQLPGTAYRLSKRQSECHLAGKEEEANEPEFGTKLRDLPRAICVLLTNVPFMFLIISSAVDSFLLNGFINFFPKYLITQLNINASQAAFFAGIAIVIGSVLGSLIGGGAITIFRMKCRTIIWYGTIMMFVSALPLLGLLLNCETPSYAGVQKSYDENTPFSGEVKLESSCNAGCNCHEDIYQPVCLDTDTIYFSPCHAGCTDYGTKNFSNCGCLSQPNMSMTTLSDQCKAPCNVSSIAYICISLAVIIGVIANIANIQGILRCVPYSQRSLATGLGWVSSRLIGMIPGPIAFGALIDQSCITWAKKCETKMSCRIYDKLIMRRNFTALILCVRSIAAILFLLAGATYRPPKEKLPDNEGNGELENNPSFSQL